MKRLQAGFTNLGFFCILASQCIVVFDVAMIQHSSNILNFSSGELLVDVMLGPQGTGEYAPCVPEEYRFLCRKAPGFEGSCGSRCKRGHP